MTPRDRTALLHALIAATVVALTAAALWWWASGAHAQQLPPYRVRIYLGDDNAQSRRAAKSVQRGEKPVLLLGANAVARPLKRLRTGARADVGRFAREPGEHARLSAANGLPLSASGESSRPARGRRLTGGDQPGGVT